MSKSPDHEADPQPVATCACGYPLMLNQRCPECGLPFGWGRQHRYSKASLVLTGVNVFLVVLFVALISLAHSDPSIPYFLVPWILSIIGSFIGIVKDLWYVARRWRPSWVRERPSQIMWLSLTINTLVFLGMFGFLLFGMMAA